MGLVLLDTTVLIDLLRGRPVLTRVRALRDSSDVPATSAVNVEEVVRGLRPAEQGAAGRLLEGLVLLGIGRPAAEQAGAWRRDHARTGTILSQADCLIAAAALHAGARLATGNPRHFPMPQVTVEHWPVGA